MKNPHRFSEPYPKNPRGFKFKQNGRTKIELDLEDAHKLADIFHEQWNTNTNAKKVLVSLGDYQLINLLIKKLRNAEEVNHD